MLIQTKTKMNYTLSTLTSRRLGLIASFLLLLSVSILLGQTKRYIKSHEYMAWLESQDASLASNRADLEATVQSTFTSVEVPSNPVIPIIFHIFFSNGAEQISETEIHNQIAALNRDYGFGLNLGIDGIEFTHEALELEGFAALSNQIGVQFCLPQFSGDSSAINYYPVSKLDWQFDNAMKQPNSGGVAPWNPAQFLNVYVVDLHDTLAVAGYAQMPGAADTSDAIVIDYRFVGNAEAPFELGRTLVHLVGNWMGLYSIWGVGDCKTGDYQGDFVTDTPNHNAPNYGCPSYQHLSTCQKEGSTELIIEQSMNLMDCTDDICMSQFTTGQKYRFYAFLQAARNGIIQHNFSCSSPSLEQPEIAPTAKINNSQPLLLSDGIKVYPNPGRDYVQIQLNLRQAASLHIQLSDLNGRILHEQQSVSNGQTLRLATTQWLTGIYLLSIHQQGKLIHSEKVAIQH